MYKNTVVYVDPDLEELIPGFLANRQKDVYRINELLSIGDLKEIQRIGHSLKGAGGGYGFVEITNIGKHIEEAAQCGKIDEIRQLNQQLAHYLATVKIVWQNED